MSRNGSVLYEGAGVVELSAGEAKRLGFANYDQLQSELEASYKDYVSGNPEAEAQKRWDAERVGVPMWIQERDEMYAKEAKARSALLNKGLPDFEYVVGKYPLTAGFFYNRDVMASAHDDIFALAAKEAEAERMRSVQKQLKGNLSRRTSWQTDNIFNKPAAADPRPRGAEAAQRWLKNTSLGGDRSPDTGISNLKAVNSWASDTSFGRGVSAGYEMSDIGTEAANLFVSSSWNDKNDEAKWVNLEKRLLALDRDKPDGWFSGMLYETGKFIGQQSQGALQTGLMSSVGAVLGAYGGGIAAGGAMLVPGAIPVLALGAMSGWFFGSKMGAFTQSAKVEAGLDVIERRMMTDADGNYLSPLAVGLGSLTVGAVNGALELMQWKIAGAPLIKLTKRSIAPAAMKTVSGAIAGRLAKLPVKAQIAGLAAKDILINDFAESLTEVAQDLVPITVDEMQKAALLDGYDRRTLADVTSQLTDTFLESVYSFLLVSAVGPFGGAIGGNYRFELMRKDIEAAETIRQGRILDGFKSKVLATKLFSRYPGMSKEHSKNLLEHADTSKVYLSAKTVETFYQSGKFADSGYESAVDWAVDNLGVTEDDYNRSITEDYDMEVEAVNLYDVLDDNEGLMKELAGEARFVRDGYTLKEAEKARKDLRLIQQEDMFKLQTGIDLEGNDLRSASVVSEAYRIQLLNEGVDDETAAADGLIAGKMFIPIARNLNNLMPLKDGKRWTPEAASKLYKLVVERDGDGKPEGMHLQTVYHGNNTYLQAIGENGAAALDAFSGVTERLDGLALARRLESEGLDALSVKQQTNWERGADGKWRYETNDSRFVLKAYPGSEAWRNLFSNKDDYSSQPFAFLKDIVLHDELLTAYPYLGDIKVYVDLEDKNRSGYYSPTDNSIHLNYDVANYFNETRELIMHEVQHAIQDNEGFASGGNSKQAARELGLTHRDMKEKARSIVARDEKFKDEHRSEYEEFIAELDKYSEDDDEYYIIQEKFEEKYPEYVEIQNLISDFMSIVGEHTPEEFLANTVKTSEYAVVYSRYLKYAGETEARNAVFRMNMTAAERRESLMSATEDVSREDQIILENMYVSAEDAVKGNFNILETYYQPVNDGIDLDTMVEVVDISQTPYLDNDISNNTLKKYLQALIGQPMTNADKKIVTEVIKGNVKHLVHSGAFAMRIPSPIRALRNAAMQNLKDLVSASVLIETVPNRKKTDITPLLSKIAQISKCPPVIARLC